MVNNNKARQAGFTLPEVMIVVAIVAILAGIAVPSYNNYVTRTNRADAKALVQEMAQRLQRCMGMYGSYDAEDAGGNRLCDVSTSANYPLTSEEGLYEITQANGFDNITATAYSLTVTPVAGGRQAGDDDCASFTLTHTGVRSAEDSGGNAVTNCW